MMILVGLLVLALWIGVPCFFLGAFFFYRWEKRRPGVVFWVVSPFFAALWVLTIGLVVAGYRHQTTSTDSTAAASQPAPVSGSSTRTLHLPGWDSTADGNTWLRYSEADKQKFCTSSATASSNHHTAAFFYTNVNASYDPTQADSLKLPLIALFLKLDAISPQDSYPPFQGFSWQRLDLQHMDQDDVKMICVFWQDGHTFIHDQKIQPDGSYTAAGMDGPWDGDIATYTGTTTVSGNRFTIQINGANPPTQTGTFQVSSDGQELDLTEDGRPPARYSKVATLVNGPL